MDTACSFETLLTIYETEPLRITVDNSRHGNRPSGFIRVGEFHDYLNAYCLLKDDSAPWG
jgi:hypothetical protein